MHSLQKQFHEFVQAQELLSEDSKVLLAVSGGMDSLVMAELFFQSSWQFGIAHCNFNLRGKESAEDEAFVREWAKKKEAQLDVKQFDLESGSVQLNAREARYQWFDELMQEKGYDVVATAHHLDDSFETLLINLSRGTGIKGLVGIQPKKGNRIRPLLFATKDQLKIYAEENSIKWREDSSNAKKDYDRNLLRHDVIPKMKELNPSLVDTFRNTAERIRLTNQLVRDRIEEAKETNLLKSDDCYEFRLGWMQTESDNLILSEILSDFGFNYSTSKEIIEAKGKSGKQFLSDDFMLTMDRESLFIQHTVKRQENETCTIDGYGDFTLLGRTIQVSEVHKEEVIFDKDELVAYLDLDRLEFPVQIRTWSEGDRFIPLGMTGSKKVSDILIDKKVAVSKKDDVLVALSEDQIIWLMGYQIADFCKISDTTHKIVRFSMS